MFEVEIDRMGEICRAIEDQYREYCQLNDELEATIRELETMSAASLDEFIRQLKEQREQFERQQLRLRNMAQGLDKIAISYIRCENEICDSGEQAVRCFQQEEAGITNLSGIRSMLKGIVFR